MARTERHHEKHPHHSARRLLWKRPSTLILTLSPASAAAAATGDPSKHRRRPYPPTPRLPSGPASATVKSKSTNWPCSAERHTLRALGPSTPTSYARTSDERGKLSPIPSPSPIKSEEARIPLATWQPGRVPENVVFATA